MANLLLELANHLAQLDWIMGDGIDTFRNYQPETPDEIVALTEYRGVSSHYSLAGIRPVQIVVRHRSPDIARERANELYRLLFDTEEDNLIVETEDRPWSIMTPINPPALLERDEQERTIFSFNVSIVTTID